MFPNLVNFFLEVSYPVPFLLTGTCPSMQEKVIFFLGAQPGDKNFLQTNGVFLCKICMCINI
jgi:hypothetical protein